MKCFVTLPTCSSFARTAFAAEKPSTSHASSKSGPCGWTKNGSDFIYTRNKAATDVTCTVEWSDTLTNDWSIAGVSAPAILSDNGTTQQIKVSVPAGGGVTRRFVHLKVTRP